MINGKQKVGREVAAGTPTCHTGIIPSRSKSQPGSVVDSNQKRLFRKRHTHFIATISTRGVR